MKKALNFLFCCIPIFLATGCGKSCNPPNSKVEITFFDIENSSDGKIHYDGVNNDLSFGYTAASPSDSFMIKVGDIEILVDAGISTSILSDQRVAKIYQDNVLKKIEQICTDGILDYVIVTHGDYDHIAGFAADGGIFDYYLNDKNKSIKNIIDFDSDLVVYLSNVKGSPINSPYNLLINSETVTKYRKKRDMLVENDKTSHVPAALFFKNTKLLKENVMVNAMPEKLKENYFEKDEFGNRLDVINTTLLANFYYFGNNIIYNQKCNLITKEPEDNNIKFLSTYPNETKLGELKSENDRYYYSIHLKDDVELRILYNWSYDHIYKHSFDSQNRNNISVCFEVLTGSQKFVSFGDMGYGESGLINYYKDTSILKNISCFKASHHGSTSNNENSKDLFELMKPKVVVVLGVAQISRKILESSKLLDDPIYSSLKSVALMDEMFFENILSHSPETKILVTQIVKQMENDNTKFISASFYGDISVKLTDNDVIYSCSKKDEIEGYVTSYTDDLRKFKFSIYQDDSLLSYNETEFWEIIYEGKGKR